MDKDMHYSADYTVDWSQVDDNDPEGDLAMDIIGTVVHDLRKYEEEAVKVINPVVKQQYDQLLTLSDKMAKEYNGRIEGIVIVERNRAEIILEIPCFDFYNEEEHSFVRQAMEYTSSLALEPTKDGMLRFRMMFDYFQPLHTKEEHEAFLREAARNLQKKIEELS